jgi:hypothetical protein
MKALPFPQLQNVLVGLISGIAVILPYKYLLLGMVYPIPTAKWQEGGGIL